MNPQPGEVWLADLGLAAKTRPVVIVSRLDPNAPRVVVLYVPLTTQNRLSGTKWSFRDCPTWIGTPWQMSKDSGPSPGYGWNGGSDGFLRP